MAINLVATLETKNGMLQRRIKMKPTEAQKKELLEWCGFTLRCPPEKDAYKRGIWNYPDGMIGDVDLALNNLWKYAIPQLCKEYRSWRSLLHDWVDQCTGDYEKDTLLLFAQTYDIIKEKRGEVNANRDI